MILFASLIALTNACGSLSVETRGARLVSYVPRGGTEVFAVLADGSGGMPLCWPWFGGEGPAGSRRHGLARYSDFSVVRRSESSARSELTLCLGSDDETRRLFPHDFRLTLTFVLTEKLTVTMTDENMGAVPFSVTEAFHPYFRVLDAFSCRVEGGDVAAGSIAVGGGVRDIPLSGAESRYRLDGAGVSACCSFVSRGAKALRVWNPGPSGHLSKTISSRLLPGEWRRFVCLENGCFRRSDAYVLDPGQSHALELEVMCP